MLVADYHNHPQAHREDLPYSQKVLQPWADKAKELGLQDLAFTDHDRYKAGVNFDEIEILRENNPEVKFRSGLRWIMTQKPVLKDISGLKRTGAN